MSGTITNHRISQRAESPALAGISTLVISVVALLSLLGLSAPVAAAADTGDLIMAAVDAHEEGYIDFRSNVTMVLENANGEKKVRQLRISSVELTPLGDHRKFIFDNPKDIKGTAVLIHSNVVVDDKQWIFLPAFKRVKRISSNNKSTPFLGSEFSYEDLASQEQEKYKNTRLDVAEVDGLLCHIVERIPLYQNSAYKFIRVYVDEQHSRFRKIEYFDLDGELIKTQSLYDYNVYQNRYHLPGTTKMTNHQTGKTTTLKWNDIQLNTKLSSKDFTVASLKRQR